MGDRTWSRRAGRGVLALTGALGLVGCSGASCKEFAAPGVRVHVTDAAGAPACDATVTLHDGRYDETLLGLLGDTTAACSYAGAYERQGTYRVTAARAGVTATVTGVKVSADACHVRPQDVSLALDTKGP